MKKKNEWDEGPLYYWTYSFVTDKRYLHLDRLYETREEVRKIIRDLIKWDSHERGKRRVEKIWIVNDLRYQHMNLAEAEFDMNELAE
jgi:hypothetical protein